MRELEEKEMKGRCAGRGSGIQEEREEGSWSTLQKDRDTERRMKAKWLRTQREKRR